MARTRMTAVAVAAATLLGVATSTAPPAGAAARASASCALHVRTHVGRFGGILAPHHIARSASCGVSANGPSAGLTPPALPYTGTPPLLNSLGPVMGTTAPITITPVYWAPPGYGFPSTYKSLTTRFLTDVAHDSGQQTNVFSALTQYTDASNRHVVYDVVAGTPLTDTSAIPSSGGCSHDAGQTYSDGTGYTTCVTDSQVTQELSSVLSTAGLPSDQNHLYLVYLPKGVETCFDASNIAQGGSCSISAGGGTFCGYHSYVGSLLYANLPYAIEDNPQGGTCSSDGGATQGGHSIGNQSPNSNLDADAEISVASHEIAEAIIDPYINAWSDSSGNEIGDDCGYIYGDTSTFLGSAGSYYNQVINGHEYFIQEEFSNQEFAANSGSACVQAALTQTVSFTSTPPTNPPINSGYVVTATATSGLAATVSIAPSSASVCTLSGSASGSFVAFKAKGTCTIDASQAGSSRFQPAAQSQQAVAVGGAVTDGAGTLSVNPTSVRQGATRTTLALTYTAPTTGVVNGEVDVAVPGGWSAPSTTTSAPGAVTSTCGPVGVSASTIDVTPVTLGASAQCTIVYGSTTGGGPGATAPSSLTTSQFTASEKSTAAGALTALAASPSVTTTTSADGSGTLSLPLTTAREGASGLTLTFTYTAATGGTSGGEVDVTVPAGWSAPSATPTAPGAVSTTCGSAGVAGTTIRLTDVTLASGAQCTVTFGSKSQGGPGVTAPSSTGTSTFPAAEKSAGTGTLTALAASPVISVTAAADGAGTMTVPATSLIAGSSGHTLTFTYTAAAAGITSGEIDVAIPAGWSAPSTAPSAAGDVTSSCGTVATSAHAIQLTGVTLAGGAACTTTYGATGSGGHGAIAGPTGGVAIFATSERSSASGTLTGITTSPKVTVTRAVTSTTLHASVAEVTYGAERALRLTMAVTTAGTTLAVAGRVTVTAGAVVVCSAALVAGRASCAPRATTLAPGKSSLLATYSGTAGLGASTSTQRAVTVARAGSSTNLTLSTTTAAFGKEGTVRLTVLVRSKTPGLTPLGTVTITAGTATVCKLTLLSSKATCTLSASALKAGTAMLVATYSGGTGIAGSASLPQRLVVTA